MKKKIVCVIPARLASTRFPKKILAPLLNKPLLQWVWEAASKVTLFDEIVFAIDAQETADVLQSINAPYIMTPETCQSGTDRIIYLQTNKLIQADIWVGWQCDEPFITTQMIQALLKNTHDHTLIWTLKKIIENPQEITDPNTVKVVCDAYDNALYFSRAPIPYNQSGNNTTYFKHIGIYAYTSIALKKIANLSQSPLEKIEKLEQLRFLQNNLTIKVNTTNRDVIGINTPHDLQIAQEYAKQQLTNTV